MPTPEKDIKHLKVALDNIESVSAAGVTIGMRDDLVYAMDVIELAIKAKQRLAEERKAKA